MEVFIESHPEVWRAIMLQETSGLVECADLRLGHPNLDGVGLKDSCQTLEEIVTKVELRTQGLEHHHTCRR